MSKIQTPITGITTTSAYDEGSCFSLVNLRPKNGALHPVSPRKIMQQLSKEYDIIFIHQNNDYKNWVGVINHNGYSSVYWDARSPQTKSIKADIQDQILSVQQIGNTLSFISTNKIYYAWYTNGKYTFLGEIPQIPLIRMDTSANMSHARHYFFHEYGSGTIKPDNFIDSIKGLVNKAMHTLMNGWKDKEGIWQEGDGMQLFDACFIRYAFRLYDGSLTKHSPPILVMPVRHIVGSKEDEQEDKSNLDSIKIISYDFDGTLRNESCVDVYGYRINMYYNFTQLGGYEFEKWVDIIKSVDIFMSAPLGLSSIENIRTDMPTTDSPRILNFNLIKGLSPESLKRVSNTSVFYLVRSIDIGTIADSIADELPSKESDFSKIDNLIYQEVMTDDNLSNHTYGAQVSYAYNNRLHIANIKTTFFNGFNLGYFQWSGKYNNENYGTEKVTCYFSEIDIQAGASLEKVYSKFVGLPKLGASYKMFTSAFLSYPDIRAKRMTIYEVNNEIWTKVFSAPLEAHNLLNIAYYLHDGLKPIVGRSSELVAIPDTSKPVTLSEPNKIKVSALNNQLSFPNTNTYQVSNGTILAMATNAMNVSDRNYGQYPLYIFTNQGIWNLNVGSEEVVYSTQSAPTSSETPINSIVESTPFGVVFVSTRGLMLINGQDTTFISWQIEQPYKRLEHETNPQIEELLHRFNTPSFSEYLKSLSELVYDPYQNELIICNKESGYNYVLNFYAQSFYLSTEIVDSVVKNTFPDLYVIGENKLKYYLESESKRTHISLILRPLTYGNELTKWLQTLKISFTLYNVERMFVGIYASSDQVKFPGRYGKFYGSINRAVCYDTKTMARNTGRYFLVSFAAVLDEDSFLDTIESEVTTKYEKM